MSILDALKKRKAKGSSEKKTSSKVKTAQSGKVEKALIPGKVRIDAGGKDGEILSHIIISPRITEKASFQAADGVYTFNVYPKANKIQIKRAISEMYGINPIRVAIINIPSKKVIIRGKKGIKSGGKKALVYLKDGDKIEFV